MEAQREKEQERARRAAQTMASKALAKLCPVYMQLQSDLKEPGVKDAPQVVRKRCESSFLQLDKRYLEAQKAMANNGPTTLSFTLQDVTNEVSDASNHYKELIGLLNAFKGSLKAQ